MKALKWIAAVLAVLIIAAVLFVGWLGFVPVLSDYIGPEPRDLGVELTAEHAVAGAAAHRLPTSVSELEAIAANPAAATTVDTVLTSDQASSLILVGQTGIPNWPLRYTQVRFGDNGTAEASGVIWGGNVESFLSGLGVPQDEIDTALGRVPIFGNPAFYASGTCSVSNNTVNLSLSELQIGRITVPAGWYQGNESYGTKYIDGALASNGFNVESMQISGGTVSINGTRPLSSLEPWLGLVSSSTGGGQ